MKESVQQLHERIDTNFNETNEINGLYARKLDIEDYMPDLPEPAVIDVSSEARDMKLTIKDLKEQHYGKKGTYQTNEVEGRLSSKVKTMFTDLFGGKKTEYVEGTKGEYLENLERIQRGYEKIGEAKRLMPRFETARQDYESNVVEMRKTYSRGMIQVKQMFDEENRLENLLRDIDKELESDSLGSAEYQVLMDDRQRIEDKMDAVRDYADIIGFQTEGTKNALEVMQEDSRIFSHMVRSLGKNLNKMKTKLDLAKQFVHQGDIRIQLTAVYEDFKDAGASIEAVLESTTTTLDQSNKVYAEGQRNVDSKMFSEDKITRFRQMHKDLQYQTENERQARRKRLMADIYKNDERSGR